MNFAHTWDTSEEIDLLIANSSHLRQANNHRKRINDRKTTDLEKVTEHFVRILILFH